MSWLSGWENRIKITVSNTNIDSSLTHFPLLLTLGTSIGTGSSDVSFIFDELGSNKLKIALTKTDGITQLYGEIEDWNSTSEKAHIWVSKSDLVLSNTTTTDLYFYFDNNQPDNTTYIGAPNSTPAQSVWDSNFEFVCHMKDDPNTSSVRDSSDNNRDGAKYGPDGPTTDTSSKIGEGQDFDGSNDVITVTGYKGILGTSARTVSAWLKTTFGVAIINWGTNSSGAKWTVRIDTSNSNILRLEVNGGYQTGSTNLGDGEWHHIAVSTEDKVDLNVTDSKLYVDGGKETIGASASHAIDIISGGDVIIGLDLVDRYFNGGMDEVRISSTQRNDGWIKAEYYSEDDNLVSWGFLEVEITQYIFMD